MLILAEAGLAADPKKKYITTNNGKKIEVEQISGGFIPEALAELRRDTADHMAQIQQEATCVRDGVNVWECPATKLHASKFSNENLAQWIRKEEGNIARIKTTIIDKEKRITELKKYPHFKNSRTLDHVMMESDTATAEIIKQRIAILRAIKKRHQNPEDRLDLYNAMFIGDVSCGFFLLSNPTLELSAALFSNNEKKTAGAKYRIYEETERCRQLVKNNLPTQEKFRPKKR
jgi:hypothetical protein